MTVAEIIALIIQVIQAAQVLTPATLQAVADFEKLFEGKEPTQSDFDALIFRLQSQSAEIQTID